MGVCQRCYARLPLESRHLFDPSERPWSQGQHVGTWLDSPPEE